MWCPSLAKFLTLAAKWLKSLVLRYGARLGDASWRAVERHFYELCCEIGARREFSRPGLSGEPQAANARSAAMMRMSFMVVSLYANNST